MSKRRISVHLSVLTFILLSLGAVAGGGIATAVSEGAEWGGRNLHELSTSVHAWAVEQVAAR